MKLAQREHIAGGRIVRRLFQERLEPALRRARRDGSDLAVMQLGLDRFRQINDTLGQGTGDALLKGVAERHGPDALGFVSSSRCTMEENFLVQKLARAVFRTNNVHQCAAT